MWAALIWVGIAALFALGLPYRRWRVRTGRHPGVFHALESNLVASLWGWGLLLHLLAAAATVALVLSGWDRAVQDVFQHHDPMGLAFPYVCLAVGNFWHWVTGVGVLAVGKVRRSQELVGAGLAGVQAVALSGILTAGEKILTGRRGPARLDVGWYRSAFVKTEDATDFRFDFWNHTLRDGRFFWPSGHTATAIAFASAMVAFYPEKKWLPWVVYPLGLLMGVAMIDGDFHWASDVVAGALIGHAIGWPTGRSFRTRYRDASASPPPT